MLSDSVVGYFKITMNKFISSSDKHVNPAVPSIQISTVRIKCAVGVYQHFYLCRKQVISLTFDLCTYHTQPTLATCTGLSIFMTLHIVIIHFDSKGTLRKEASHHKTLMTGMEPKTKQNKQQQTMTFNSYTSSIKQYIKTSTILISNNMANEVNISPSTIYSAPRDTRLYYNILVNDNCMPNCCLKWSEKLKSNISWNTVFIKVQKIKDVKLKWLQMHIIHRIIATNIVLNKMGVTANTQCGFCDDEKDSIEHMFWECACIRCFYVLGMCLYQMFLDFAGNNIERKMWDSAKCKIYTESYIVWNRNRHQNWHSLWLSDTSSYAIIYKCKLDKCLPTLSCFLQQLMLKYKIDEYNAKISGKLPTFILNWLCYKPILKTENWWPQGICSYFRFRIYTYVTGSHSLIVQGKYLSMKYFVQLIVCMDVCMDVSFCLLCMYSMCMYVIHCRNGCTDTYYNCVIFVILRKKRNGHSIASVVDRNGTEKQTKQSHYHISCWQEWNRKTNKSSHTITSAVSTVILCLAFCVCNIIKQGWHLWQKCIKSWAKLQFFISKKQTNMATLWAPIQSKTLFLFATQAS